MQRRTFLRSTGAVASAIGVTGCLGRISSGDSSADTVLREPDRDVESSDLPYPAWGEPVPDVMLPAPLASRDISVREVDTPALLTFFYSHCQTVCPVLISTQRNLQAHARKNGYDDSISFMPVTFDPGRDTAERLRRYADRMNVDTDDDNWQFLRPSSRDRAETVVRDRFGVAFRRSESENGASYMFTHMALTLLVNSAGMVERAYRSKAPEEETIIDDLEAVIEA